MNLIFPDITWTIGRTPVVRLNRIAPAYATTTEKVGRAMIKVARDGYPKPVLESEDINRV